MCRKQYKTHVFIHACMESWLYALKHSVHSSFLHSLVYPTHNFKTEAAVNVSASGMALMVSHGDQT